VLGSVSFNLRERILAYCPHQTFSHGLGQTRTSADVCRTSALPPLAILSRHSESAADSCAAADGPRQGIPTRQSVSRVGESKIERGIHKKR
jgi:hypothetical protein